MIDTVLVTQPHHARYPPTRHWHRRRVQELAISRRERCIANATISRSGPNSDLRIDGAVADSSSAMHWNG